MDPETDTVQIFRLTERISVSFGEFRGEALLDSPALSWPVDSPSGNLFPLIRPGPRGSLPGFRASTTGSQGLMIAINANVGPPSGNDTILQSASGSYNAESLLVPPGRPIQNSEGGRLSF